MFKLYLPDRLCNACVCGNIITPRVWMTKGMRDTLFSLSLTTESISTQMLIPSLE